MDAWVIEEGGEGQKTSDALICKRARAKLKDSYWYSVFNLLYLFCSPPPSLSLAGGCQRGKFASRRRLIYMCPRGNKPVSFSSGSYVTGGRPEGWPQRRFMASSNPTRQGNWPVRQLRWGWRIGFVPLVLQLPDRERRRLAGNLALWTDFSCERLTVDKKDKHDKHVGILQSNSGLVCKARKGPKIWPFQGVWLRVKCYLLEFE